MANAFTLQGATPGFKLQGTGNSGLMTTTPSTNGTLGQSQGLGNFQSMPTPNPVTAGVHPSLLSPLLSQGGSHTTTDTTGNTQTTKINPPKPGLIDTVDKAKVAGAAAGAQENPQPTPPPVASSPVPTTPQPSPYQQSISNLTQTANTNAGNINSTATNAAGNITGAGTAGAQAITAASQASPQYQALANELATLKTQEAQQEAGTANGALLGDATGQRANIQNVFNAKENAIQGEMGNVFNQQQLGQTGATSAGTLATNAAGTAGNLATGAAESAAGTQNTANQGAVNATAPQPYGLTTQPYNPTTDTYGGGGAGGAINRSTQAANIGSASDLQTKINTAGAALPTATSDFNILNSIASQGATSNSAPILTQLIAKYGQTVGGQDAPAVAQFKAQLQTVRNDWTNLGLGDGATAIPDNVTPAQLTQIQQSLTSNVGNLVAGYKQQLSSLGGSSNNNSTPTSGWASLGD